jgi:hypothetical protein
VKIGPERARRPSRRRASLILAGVAALVVVCGCANEEKKVPSGAVSVPRAAHPKATAPEASGKVTKKDVDEALAGMAAAIQHGDYERALGIGDELLRRQPGEEARQEVERLRKVAKQHLLQSFYLDAVVRADKERVTIGEQIKGEVTLINVGTEPVTIEDQATNVGQGASRTLLHLEVGYREFVPDGSLVQETLTQNVILGRKITIAPGKRYSMPLDLDTLAQNPAGTMLRNYDIGGTVFLAELKVGKETIYGQLKLKTKRVQVFPRNYEHLADHPLDRLSEAIRKRSPPHIPLAAALVPESQRRAAMTVIRDALKQMPAVGPDDATVKACCVALVILTGEERKPDAEAWLHRLDELLS